MYSANVGAGARPGAAERSSAGETPSRAMRALDLSSNYELVRTLAPYVASRTASYGDFALAVRQAVNRRLPDLVGHLAQVTAYLAEYYGLDQVG
jgi:hypothetical protein